MATTTNFGWETPDDTDLVKDGAAAIRTALGGVDTSFVDLKGGTTGQVLAKASNTDLDFVWSADAAGMTNPMTTTGDTIYSSSGSTPARLGIGSTGNILTVSGGLPVWAAPAPGGGMTQIASTSLSGGATTVSSIPGTYKTIFIVIDSVSTSANGAITFTVNGQASDYAYAGTNQIQNTTSTTGAIADTAIRLSASQALDAGQNRSAYALTFFNYAGSANKIFEATGWTFGSVNNAVTYVGGAFRQTTAITSCTVSTAAGSFDNGTITVYGVN
jgi:hypothetical protein